MSITEHINLQTLDSYHRNELADADRRAVDNHLLWCFDCRRFENEYRDIVHFFTALSREDGNQMQGAA